MRLTPALASSAAHVDACAWSVVRSERGLVERGRDVGEPRPVQHLDEPALLVCRDVQRLAVGRVGRHQLGERVDQVLHPFDTGVRTPGQEHVADVVVGDRVIADLFGTDDVDADHEQLSDPLLERPAGQRVGRDGLGWSRRRGRRGLSRRRSRLRRRSRFARRARRQHHDAERRLSDDLPLTSHGLSRLSSRLRWVGFEARRFAPRTSTNE